MKRRITTYLLFLLLPLVLAAQNHQADIDRLTKEMYRLYSSHEIELFMNVTDQLKEACLKAKDEGLFYRTWANQASFAFSRISREKGMEIAKAMNEYSQQNDSKLGFYYSSIANANQASALRMEIKAEEYYQKAIKYKQAYLPQINAAPVYLGLAKIYHNRRDQKKVLEMTDKALKEPNLTGPSIVDAWSYRCIAAMYNQGEVQKAELNKTYTEWKRLSEKYNYRSSFADDIEIYHAQVNGDYEKMLELAQKAKLPQEKYKLMSYAYEWQGKWKEALKYYKEYKKASDSTNTADIRKQAAEHAMQMDIIRAENQTKELLLHNQSLKLAHAQDELEQRQLEEEALSLTLKNREIELSNASIKLKNDSLDRQAQQSKLSEYQSKLELEQNKEKIEAALPGLDRISEVISQSRALPDPGTKAWERLTTPLVLKPYYKLFVRAKAFKATDSCIGCGKCAALCPLGNITLRDKKPVWGSNCTHCTACINLCPKDAVEYGKKTRGKPRYHGPDDNL